MRGLPQGYVSTPWALVKANGATLTLTVAGGGCITFDHFIADQSESEVVITAISRDARKPDVACTMELSLTNKTQTLEAPLGTRALLHAPVGNWGGEKHIQPRPS